MSDGKDPKLNIEINTSDGVKSCDELGKSLDSLSKKTVKSVSAVNKSNSVNKETLPILKELVKSSVDLGNQIKRNTSSHLGSADATKNSLNSLKNLTSTVSSLTIANKGFSTGIGHLNTAVLSQSKAYKNLTNKNTKLAISVGQLRASNSSYKKQVTSLNAGVKKLEGSYKELSASIKKTKKDTDSLAKSTNKLDKIYGLLKTAASLYVVGNIGKALSGLKNLADGYQNAVNKISVFSRSSLEASKSQEELFKMSQRSRLKFSDVGSLFNRLSISRKNLKASNEEILTITEAISKSLIISGSTPTEARGAFIQIGQAMSMSSVKAEEFNSALEGFPALMSIVATHVKGTGNSIAGLRLKVLKGKLASKEFFEAIKKSAPEIEKLFSRITPTISQSWNTIYNAAQKYVGVMAEATGVNSMVTSSMLGLSSNFSTITSSVISYGSAFIGAFAVKYIFRKEGALRKYIATQKAAIVGQHKMNSAVGVSISKVRRLGRAFKVLGGLIRRNLFTLALFGVGALLDNYLNKVQKLGERLSGLDKDRYRNSESVQLFGGKKFLPTQIPEIIKDKERKARMLRVQENDNAQFLIEKGVSKEFLSNLIEKDRSTKEYKDAVAHDEFLFSERRISKNDLKKSREEALFGLNSFYAKFKKFVDLTQKELGTISSELKDGDVVTKFKYTTDAKKINEYAKKEAIKKILQIDEFAVLIKKRKRSIMNLNPAVTGIRSPVSSERSINSILKDQSDEGIKDKFKDAFNKYKKHFIIQTYKDSIISKIKHKDDDKISDSSKFGKGSGRNSIDWFKRRIKQIRNENKLLGITGKKTEYQKRLQKELNFFSEKNVKLTAKKLAILKGVVKKNAELFKINRHENLVINTLDTKKKELDFLRSTVTLTGDKLAFEKELFDLKQKGLLEDRESGKVALAKLNDGIKEKSLLLKQQSFFSSLVDSQNDFKNKISASLSSLSGMNQRDILISKNIKKHKDLFSSDNLEEWYQNIAKFEKIVNKKNSLKSSVEKSKFTKDESKLYANAVKKNYVDPTKLIITNLGKSKLSDDDVNKLNVALEKAKRFKNFTRQLASVLDNPKSLNDVQSIKRYFDSLVQLNLVNEKSYKDRFISNLANKLNRKASVKKEIQSYLPFGRDSQQSDKYVHSQIESFKLNEKEETFLDTKIDKTNESLIKQKKVFDDNLKDFNDFSGNNKLVNTADRKDFFFNINKIKKQIKLSGNKTSLKNKLTKKLEELKVNTIDFDLLKKELEGLKNSRDGLSEKEKWAIKVRAAKEDDSPVVGLDKDFNFAYNHAATLVQLISLTKQWETSTAMAFTEIIFGAKSAADAFEDLGNAMLKSFVNSAISNFVTKSIQQGFSKAFTVLFSPSSNAGNNAGTNAGNNAGTNAGNSSVYTSAKGGTAFKGKPYLIGEKGPELFTPNQTGFINSTSSLNKGLLNSKGSDVVVNVINNTNSEVNVTQTPTASGGTNIDVEIFNKLVLNALANDYQDRGISYDIFKGR